MSKETLHMKVGPLLGEHLLEIVQSNIIEGNIEKGLNTYILSLCGFTKEYALMLLKNKAVLITDEDGEGVTLSDDPELLKENEHRITNWNWYFNKMFEDIMQIRESLVKVDNKFIKYYHGDIEDYSILEMMERYFAHEELKQIGLHNIAARILGSFDGKICDKGSSNPTSIWERLEGQVESYLADIDEYGESDMAYPPAKWEIILNYSIFSKFISILCFKNISIKSFLIFCKTFITKWMIITFTCITKIYKCRHNPFNGCFNKWYLLNKVMFNKEYICIFKIKIFLVKHSYKLIITNC